MLRFPLPTPKPQPDLATDSFAADTDELQWRETLLTAILRTASALGLIAVVVAAIGALQTGQWGRAVVYLVTYGMLLVLTLFQALPYWLRSQAVLTIVYVLALADLFTTGLSGDGRVLLFAFTLLALLLMGPRAGLIATVTSLTTIGAVGWLLTTGQITIPESSQLRSYDAYSWVVSSIVFLLLAAVIILAIVLLQRNYAVTLILEKGAMAELRLEREQLEERVAERTRTIERRTAQVATGADIARVASTELGPEKLLRQVVNLIRDRFDFYYVGAFLLDSNQRFAVLKAGTGEAGQVMLANKHRLEVGGQSMIGHAVSERKARIALDVGQEAVRFSNPVLPRTRSEMALPLIARDRAIGALSIQSDQPEAFSPEDILSLQSMADLIAIALDNARLFQEAQRALEEVSAVHKTYLSQAWSTFAQTHSEGEEKVPTYLYADNTLSRGESITLPELDQAVVKRRPIIATDESASTLTVPIKLRDQVIGALAIESDSPDHIWSPDELALIEAVTEQAALSLENARLIEEAETALAETRRLAAREQTVNTISSKIRRLPSVESILTTALVELGRTLGASKGQVRLGSQRRTTPAEVSDE